MLGNGIVDPITREHAKGEEELEHTSKPTSDLLGCHFTAIHGNDDRRDSDTKSRDCAASVPCSNAVVREEELKDSADVEDERSEDDGPATSVFRGKRPNEETGEEG